MCKGKCVYNGPPDSLVAHFRTLGHACPKRDNPADFALDVLIEIASQPEEIRRFRNAYRQSDMHREMLAQLPQPTQDDDLTRANRQAHGAPGRPFWIEVYYVSRRTLKNAITNPALFLSQIVVSIVLGLLVGLVFNDLDMTPEPGVQNRLGAIFFIIVSQIFSTVTALEPFLKERALFIHVSRSSS